MQKKMGQLSFADSLVNGASNFLSEVGTVLDWSFLERELSGIYSGTGRPSYPLLMLFKTLLCSNGTACRTLVWRRPCVIASAFAGSWA